MNVCFVISSLRQGGAERVVSLIANELTQINNFSVNIITVNKAMPAYALSSSVTLHDLQVRNNKTLPLNSIERVFKTTKKIREIKPDIIISFMTATNCETIIASKIVRKPLIISERSNPYFSCVNIFWKAWRRIGYPFVDRLVCQTQGSKDFYSWVKRTTVIFNPVRNIKTQLCTNKKEPFILAVGSLKPEKGFDLLIKAFALAVTNNKTLNWKLIIVGEGSERSNLEKLIVDLRLESKVALPGASKNVDDYYSTASIFALSSKYEGMPNVLVEALSCGLPCISFDCDYGPSEVLANESGVLIENGNVYAFSSKLEELMAEPQIRRLLSQRAKKRAKAFHLTSITHQWIHLINEIVKYGKK
tara:strand:+ start:3917 stop:4999 length:1083 start_codon:yes stop_codon:yes gene_type:complete